MFGIVIGLVVLIVWWSLALLVALFRVKPNDKRYRKRGPGVGIMVGGVFTATVLALFIHNSGE